MEPVLQSRLPAFLWRKTSNSKLPGIQPLANPLDWVLNDEAFADQMALRDRSISEQTDKVLALHESARPAARELLDHVLATITNLPGYQLSDTSVTRPDGVDVEIDREAPLATAGRLVQEDLCLMQPKNGEHLLSGAVLCFPAGWTLAEKFMRPLVAIHRPVKPYDQDIARRVQRLFDGIKVDRPLWRYNGLFYDNPALFAPFTEAEPRPKLSKKAPYFRVERQCLLRLPRTDAVVFSIHTYLVARENLSDEQCRAISAS